jgi:signal transduction histidine kinase
VTFQWSLFPPKGGGTPRGVVTAPSTGVHPATYRHAGREVVRLATTTIEPAARRRRVLAWTLFAVAAAAVALGSTQLLMRLADGRMSGSDVGSQFVLLFPAVAFSVVGLVVALRQPRNACGWLMLVIGTFWSLGVSPPTEGDSALARLGSGGWVLPLGLMATHLPLRLPDGELPSLRWRHVSRAATLAMALTAIGIAFGAVEEGEPPLTPWADAVGAAGLLLLAITAVLSIASLVVRSRRAGPTERHQLRWIASGAVAFIAMWIVSVVVTWGEEPGLLLSAILLGFYAAIPISIGIAILRYRLYDIDVVIRKALIVAVVAAFFVSVYGLVVGGIGALVEREGSTTLSFAAAVIAAILFQPVLTRARRFGDRFVYGERATPYEVLAEFGEHLAGTYAADDVPPRTARMLAEGVGADRATVWLAAGSGMRPVATWPADSAPADADADSHMQEVRHQGELLGALSVRMPANDPMDPAKERLIADVAAQAGLVLRNVALVEDLRASRRRLVSAQDEERRKLERNIHDGAQQQLVALAVKARLARQLTARDPAKASSMLEEVEADTMLALEDLRSLARGIYPPLLADKGLAAALRSQAERSPLEVQVSPDGIARYPQPVEAAVYFSVLEALQNVAKYAHASRADVLLRQDGNVLLFEVRDDGAGFDLSSTTYGTGLQGIADRLAALDGRLTVDSAPGAGTTVIGSIPIA